MKIIIQPKTDLVALAWMMFAVSLSLFSIGIPIIFDDLRGTFFPPKYMKTQGEIVVSRSRSTYTKNVSTLVPEIRYKYRVLDNVLEGDNINFESTKGREDVIYLVNTYVVGKKVTVYYDESKPHFSVLEPNSKVDSGLLWMIGVNVFCIVAFGLCIPMTYRWRTNLLDHEKEVMNNYRKLGIRFMDD